jgi:hypothetical protein
VPQVKEKGTSDSGGGTGIDGKVFESYIVDPTTLPAFQHIVKPMLENIKSTDEKTKVNLSFWFKAKTWYIAPVNLEKVGKDGLGLDFLKSDTQQMARQSQKEIWIDKRIYDSMSEKDQAELLIHEWVMTLYFVRFVSMKDMCFKSQLLSGRDESKKLNCDKLPDSWDKDQPPEEPRPLTELDNTRIRTVAGWVIEKTRNQIPNSEFLQVLKVNGFDKRFFRMTTPDDGQSKEITLSKKDLLTALKATQLTGFMPEICTTVDKTSSAACKVEITDEEGSFENKNMKIQSHFLKMNIIKDNKVLAFLKQPIYENQKLVGSYDSNGDIFYNLSMGDFRYQVTVGDQLNSAILFFRKAKDTTQQLLLESILVRKGIITSIDVNRNPVCQVQASKSNGTLDDGILVHQKQNDTLIYERMFLVFPPFAMCSKDNVN